MKYCYKLVDKKTLKSWNNPNTDFSLQYELNKRTSKIRGSLGIFVFTKIKHARDFADMYKARHNSRLFKCTYTGDLTRQNPIDWPTQKTEVLDKHSQVFKLICVEHSYVVNSVTLVKEMKI